MVFIFTVVAAAAIGYYTHLKIRIIINLILLYIYKNAYVIVICVCIHYCRTSANDLLTSTSVTHLYAAHVCEERKNTIRRPDGMCTGVWWCCEHLLSCIDMAAWCRRATTTTICIYYIYIYAQRATITNRLTFLYSSTKRNYSKSQNLTIVMCL